MTNCCCRDAAKIDQNRRATLTGLHLLRYIRADAEALLAEILSRSTEYAATGGPFPDRLPIVAITGKLLMGQYEASVKHTTVEVRETPDLAPLWVNSMAGNGATDESRPPVSRISVGSTRDPTLRTTMMPNALRATRVTTRWPNELLGRTAESVIPARLSNQKGLSARDANHSCAMNRSLVHHVFNGNPTACYMERRMTS